MYKLFANIINRRKNKEMCYQGGNTVNSDIFREGFVFAKLFSKKIPREIAKSLCRLLMKVNNALVENNFNVANKS